MSTTNTSATEVLEITDKGLKAVDSALDLHKKLMNQLIPWNELEDIIEKLQKGQDDYSEKAGALVGKVQTLLMNSRDCYHQSVQSVVEWCLVASPLLGGYLDLFQDFDKEKASAQKKILLKVLESGKTKMENAQKELSESSKNFNDASGQLTALNTVLHNDFTEGSSYVVAKVDTIRTTAYSTSAASIAFGPLGIVVTYGTVTAIVEGKLIPTLMEQLGQIQAAYSAMGVLVKSAQNNIVDAKEKIKGEIQTIGNMKAKTEETEFWVELDDLMLKQLKDSANSLITLCDEYIKTRNNLEI